MPIHVAGLSRRQFLSRTIAGLSGVLVAPQLVGAPTRGNPDSWVLFSDTHIAADRALKARGINMADHLHQAVAEVLALPERPAGVFVNGDCAYNSGQQADYRTFMELLTPLREVAVPLHLGLGNHDDRENFRQGVALAMPGERQPVEHKHVALIRSRRANWFLLDSLERTASTPGWLGHEQLEWLAGTLDANRKIPAIVMLHHNPGILGNMGLKDTVPLFEVIRSRIHVKALIYGHTHTWVTESDTSGLHLINLPAVGYAFKEGEPSGWVQAMVNNHGMVLRLSATDRTHKAHGQLVDLKWRA